MKTGNTTLPIAVHEVLRHVRKALPRVTQVLYTQHGRWMFLDEDGTAPDFPSTGIDVGLLEDVQRWVDDHYDLPVVFALPSKELLQAPDTALSLLIELAAYEAQAFENDEPVNAADLVDWFGFFRKRVRRLLNGE